MRLSFLQLPLEVRCNILKMVVDTADIDICAVHLHLAKGVKKRDVPLRAYDPNLNLYGICGQINQELKHILGKPLVLQFCSSKFFKRFSGFVSIAMMDRVSTIKFVVCHPVDVCKSLLRSHLEWLKQESFENPHSLKIADIGRAGEDIIAGWERFLVVVEASDR